MKVSWKKSGNFTMKVKSLWTAGLEIFKTLQKASPVSMEPLFHRTKCLTHRPQNIQANACKKAKYSHKSLRILGPHIWNSLPKYIKAESNFSKFKKNISQRFETTCRCNLCVYLDNLNKWTTSDLILSRETTLKYFHVFSFSVYI